MSPESMRAWLYAGPRKIEIVRRPVPEPGPGEVLVKVARAGICGSDSHGYAGESGTRQSGVVMGHEASGVVAGIGSTVSNVELGTSVTFRPTLPCDGSCGHRQVNHCTKLRIVGVHPDAPGAFAEYVLVPAARVVALDGLGLDLGAQVEPMAVGLHAARRAAVQRGEQVLVLGGGMIGQAAAQSARLMGAATVVVAEPNPDRRVLCDRLGLRTVADVSSAQPGWFDKAIDAVGLPATVAAALDSVRKGGTACVVGLGAPRLELLTARLVTFDRALMGSAAYDDADFDDALRAIAGGGFVMSPLAPRLVAFDELGTALDALADGVESAIKVTMTTGLEAA